MSETATPPVESHSEEPALWKGGVVAGIAGAAVMAVLVSLMNPPTLAVAIPALYGLAPPANGVAGWAVHLSHGAVFGVIFAALARTDALHAVREDVVRSVAVGAVYGVAIWVVAAALLMPLWLAAVGFPNAPPFPNFAVPSLLWHVVFGVVLGGAFPPLADL
ncbi:MAG: histidine kinase [Haloferacaceae archaeon]